MKRTFLAVSLLGIILVLFVWIAAVPHLAQAQVGGSAILPGGSDDVVTYIKKLYMFAIAISGVLAVAMIIVGGVFYSISGAVDKQSEGKEMVLSAIFGLILLLGSYIILQTINPELVKLRKPGGGLEKVTRDPESFCTFANTEIDPSTGLAKKCNENASPPEKPEFKADGKCSCYLETQRACNESVVTACTRKLNVAANVQIPDVRNGDLFYDESGTIHSGNIVWRYPYYIPEGATRKTCPLGPTYPACLLFGTGAIKEAILPAATGPENAQCIIYAKRECASQGPRHPAGTVPLSQCPENDQETKRIDLREWIKRC